MTQGQDAKTKERILAAAREVFAEHGPREATVRDICTRAKANVAAVNYHFGGKERLYVAVLMDFVQRSFDRYPITMGLAPRATARERLRAYIHSLLCRLRGDGNPLDEKLGRLFTSELMEPSEDFIELVKRDLMPTFDELLNILRELLPGVSDQTVQLCAAGVMGHCMLFDNMKLLIRRVRPDLALERLGVELVTDVVYRYACAGIASMVRPGR